MAMANNLSFFYCSVILHAMFLIGIRLVGGSNGCRGRLEIMAELESNTSQYYPACSNVASDNEAKVICRIIDCPSEQARRVSLNK